MANSNEVNWSDTIWSNVNDSVKTEVMNTRIVQKVIPSKVLDNDPTEIQDSSIDIANLSIPEGKTKPFVDIYVEFSLTGAQVKKEEQLNTCQTLARMGAKEIALAEDMVLFQGGNKLPAGKVKSDFNKESIKGFLNEPNISTIKVPMLANPRPGLIYGENVFSAVANGIAILTGNAQAPNFALFLPTKIYADTYVSPADASLVTTAERIKPLVLGGFYSTGTIPEFQGLLLALGGDPSKIYIGMEAKVEYVRMEGSNYFFRVVERIQYVVRDVRSLLVLNFENKEPAKKS